uniref:Uncharacterized protein n=1 Tax=Anopheles melas TaxID=34690 RepID=A0A182UCP9_9DIPT
MLVRPSSFNISPVRPCWQAYISEVHPSASRWLSAGFAVRFVGSFSFGSARVSVVGGLSPPVLGRWYETLVIGGSANVTAVLGDGSGEPGDGDGGSTVTTRTSSRAWSLNLTVCLAVDFFFTFTGEPARRLYLRVSPTSCTDNPTPENINQLRKCVNGILNPPPSEHCKHHFFGKL